MTRPMSLSDLGAVTGTSLPTLRRAMKELGDFHWIHVVGRVEDTGGRPAQLFGLDTSVQTVVGVHLAHPGMRLVATDFAGATVSQHTPAGVWDLDPETVYSVVLEFLDRLRAEHPSRRVLGIGVATPGYVDPATGTVITIGRVPGWNNLPISRRLREATGLPVTIGNDMDALASAEFGLGEAARSYAYVGYGEGVKFTMFFDGAPYMGPFGNAGLVVPGLLAEDDGDDTWLLLKVRGLLAAFAREATGSEDPEPGPKDPAALLTAFAEVLSRGPDDPAAARILERMVNALATQIAYFVHLLQPEVLVVGGALAGAPDYVHDNIEAEVRTRLPALLNNHLIVRRAQVHGEHATASGAAGVFRRRFLTEDAPALGSLVG